MTTPVQGAGGLVMLCATRPDGAVPGNTIALASAFQREGWHVRLLGVSPRPVELSQEDLPEGLELTYLPVEACWDSSDLRGWSPERIAGPAAWQASWTQDEAHTWEQQWTGPVRVALNALVKARRPDLLLVTTPVWSIAEATRSVAAEAGVPFVLEPLNPRPPGLMRGLGIALGPVSLLEAEVVAAAAAVLVPNAATEQWSSQHPAARVVPMPLLAAEVPVGADRSAAAVGSLVALGGVTGSAPLGELLDAWQLAGQPGGELIWWGAEPADRSQRALLDQAVPLGVRRLLAHDRPDQVLADASLVVALLGDRQGLPHGATAAMAVGSPVLLVAEPGHGALPEGVDLPGVTTVGAAADLIARVLVSPPPRLEVNPDAVAAVVSVTWRDLVRAILAVATP